MWSILTGGITSVFSSWMDNKTAKSEAKGRLEVAKIDAKATWETIAANGMKDSWKDEWFTIIFSIPLVSTMISPFVDLVVMLYTGGSYVDGQLLTAGLEALAGLDLAPTWYTTLLGVMVGASFGVKSITKGLKAYKSN